MRSHPALRMTRILVTAGVTLLATLLLGVAGAAVVVFGGLYDIGATKQHLQPVFTLLETTMRHSVRRRARSIEPPPLGDAALVARGAACYRDHCVQCHGAPGVAPAAFAMALQPLPGPLIDAARHWRTRELYWIVRHGIRMSGMPAWQLRLSDADLWAVVGFLGRLPLLSPADYDAQMRALEGSVCTLASPETPGAEEPVAAMSSGGSDVALLALHQYACSGCHAIPGVTGADPQVGPPLDGFARRRLIAGRLVNTTDNLVRWIRAPASIKPGTAMPDLGVTEEHARQIAAYLSRLH